MPKAKSRVERFREAIGYVISASAEMNALKEELENWRDNMPENLQQGEKAEQLQTAIEELEEIVDVLTDVESRDVEFPGMY
jgi:ferric-dicitrate binding protein FerR (iron transport regulator)